MHRAGSARPMHQLEICVRIMIGDLAFVDWLERDFHAQNNIFLLKLLHSHAATFSELSHKSFNTWLSGSVRARVARE